MTNSSFSKMTGAKQTMMSWAKRIDSFADVPDPFKPAYQALLEPEASLPYTVFAPPQVGARSRKTGERLVCEIGNSIFILAKDENSEVTTTEFPYPDIFCLEVGNIILYSWFSVFGRTPEGVRAVQIAEFNEATFRHFEPFFNKLRPAPAGTADLKTEQAKFDWLAKENFKFASYARDSLAAGETVIQAVYQPPTRQRGGLASFGLYRTLSVAHLTILTDEEIILIGDAESISEEKRSDYGGIFQYIPIRKLESVSLEERVNNSWELILRAGPDVQVERLFDATRVEEVRKLLPALEDLRRA